MNQSIHITPTFTAGIITLGLLAAPLISQAEDNCDAIKAAMSAGTARADDSVRCVFVGNRRALNQIFDDERKSSPTLEGDVEIRLIVTPAGKADAASAIGKTTTANPGFEQKILTAVKTLDFGVAKDSFQTSYTLHFYSD